MKKTIGAYFFLFWALSCFGFDYASTLARAQNGDADAQYNLAKAYTLGDGVDKNYAEALKWVNLSIKNGSAYGENMLAAMYANGEGVEKISIKPWSCLKKRQVRI